MTETVPKGSGQLDPETAAKLGLLILQASTAAGFGRDAIGERLKDFALGEVQRVLALIRTELGDV